MPSQGTSRCERAQRKKACRFPLPGCGAINDYMFVAGHQFHRAIELYLTHGRFEAGDNLLHWRSGEGLDESIQGYWRSVLPMLDRIDEVRVPIGALLLDWGSLQHTANGVSRQALHLA